MKFISTRDKNRKQYSLKETAFMGLAPDGGLFVPEVIPQANLLTLWQKAESSFTDMAGYLAGLWFAGDMTEKELQQATEQAFNFPIELRQLGDDKYTLELFHGPTFAFKDFGARFMGQVLGLLNKTPEELIILTATSGDTGSAVANGFYDIPGIKVVILYPDGKVSGLQESQMTTLEKNIFPLKVKGSFDDCQRLVKMVFNDRRFRLRKQLTSANSINLLRWIPQSFYYFYGVYLWQKLTGKEIPEIVVPSGNYGNLAAGVLAWRMGLPVKRFIAASNANDVIPRYLQTGDYIPQPSRQTIANAMDVGDPSNYERLRYLFRNDFHVLAGMIKGYACDDTALKEAIAEVFGKYAYISDPHSTVGYCAANYYRTDGFWLSTAHEAKFGEVIREVLGLETELPGGLKKFLQKEKCYTSIEADINVLKDMLLNV